MAGLTRSLQLMGSVISFIAPIVSHLLPITDTSWVEKPVFLHSGVGS